MKTRCPYPECRYEFEIPDGGEEALHICIRCGGAATFKPLDIIDKLERDYARRLAAGKAEGVADKSVGSGLVCLVEDVRSLWNVGSIFRTADGAGFDKLHLCGITGVPPRKEIEKTSLGAENSVPWDYSPGVVELSRRLEELGYVLLALERTMNSVPLTQLIREVKLTKPLCLIVGNEVTGISVEALSLCHYSAHLPMRGVKESLNVSVAFGIAAYMLAEAEF